MKLFPPWYAFANRVRLYVCDLNVQMHCGVTCMCHSGDFFRQQVTRTGFIYLCVTNRIGLNIIVVLNVILLL